MIPKVVILTEIIAPYRIPVFNTLAQRREIELHVIFLSENDPTLRQWQVYKDEIKFHYDVLPSWRWRFGGHNVLINRGVAACLKKISPRAVLCGGYNYLAMWQAASWARAHGVPLLLWSESTASDTRHSRPLIEFLKRHFVRRCRAFVAAGKSSVNYLLELGAPEENIFTAPNAVDTSLFAAAAQDARQHAVEIRARHSLPPRYFLYVGRLVRAKGVFELLEAHAQLSERYRSEVGLVFVGDGADCRDLLERASLASPGTVHFSGFVQRDELPEFYALADALVFPTHSDPWGLVVNEAMACSLPVVATSVAGCVPDLVIDGWNGFVVSPRPGELARAMTRLGDDSALRMKMGSRSRERINSNSPENWAEGMLEAVKSVFSERS